MIPKTLEIVASIQIQKAPAEVFDAITDPAKMSNYFIESGSGRMESGREIKWKWPEFGEDYLIRVDKINPPDFISFYWEMEGRDLLIEMKLEPRENNSTKITVTEKSMPNDEAGIKWLKGNTEGWANFLACLKAYLEYGINLRKGAFDFLRK